jgi:hypothetical protein
VKTKEWINSLQIPEGLEHVTLGWPGEEHGITPDAWQDYCDELAEDAFESGTPYEPLTWEEWRVAQLEAVAEAETEGIAFSHSSCDTCRVAAGSRYFVTAWNEAMTEYKTT